MTQMLKTIKAKSHPEFHSQLLDPIRIKQTHSRKQTMPKTRQSHPVTEETLQSLPPKTLTKVFSCHPPPTNTTSKESKCGKKNTANNRRESPSTRRRSKGIKMSLCVKGKKMSKPSKTLRNCARTSSLEVWMRWRIYKVSLS